MGDLSTTVPAGMAPEPPPGFQHAGFRLALLAGFGGILAVFLIGAYDSVHLLREMRVRNDVLRQASLERSQGLASVRSYLFLSHSYVVDHLLDTDQESSEKELEEVSDAFDNMRDALAGYRSSTLAEQLLINQLQQLLDVHWQRVKRLMSWTRDQRIAMGAAFYGQEVAPLRNAVLQITQSVEDADARQAAATQAQIQQDFAAMGQRLGLVLNVALGAALLLAVGSIVYILRIEGQNQRRYEEILEARGELRRLSARLLAAQEEERRGISRGLHDEVGQTLSALLVDAANLAQHIPPENTEAQAYLNTMRELASSAVNSIRDIALLLRPSMLDDLGLVAALDWQAREVSRRDKVAVKVVAENVPESLDDAVSTCVYRLVQEALHNVSSHSRANRATVTVRSMDHSIDVRVEDDGAGFDPSHTRGLGLVGMEERVKQLGGKFEIHSHPGRGTTLHATLPVKPTVRG